LGLYILPFLLNIKYL